MEIRRLQELHSLNLIAKCLGIPSPKEDIKGSEVGRVYWQEDDLERIVRYCERGYCDRGSDHAADDREGIARSRRSPVVVNTEPLIKVRGLEIAFPGSAPSLRSLNFDLFAGECLGLVGESGSGKSLTAWALMGLLPPQAAQKGSIQFQKGGGTTELCDQSHAQWRSFRKKEVAMVFQSPCLH